MNQRDVYEVYFTFPNGEVKPHPVVILSTPNVLSCENTFIGVPISHSSLWDDDEFSFPIDNINFDRPLLYPGSHIRMHLISVIHQTSISTKKLNTMKVDPFNQMFNQLLEGLFGITTEYD